MFFSLLIDYLVNIINKNISERFEKILTLISHFHTDKQTNLRYNTLCIYMWTYVHKSKKGRVCARKEVRHG